MMSCFHPQKVCFISLNKFIRLQKKSSLDEENVSAELSELYMMLETGKIAEEEFNKRESELLNRLEEIEEYKRNTLRW